MGERDTPQVDPLLDLSFPPQVSSGPDTATSHRPRKLLR